MEANQPPWPRDWLMTDERMGDRLWAAIDRVPAVGGIVFRHYSMPDDERAKLARRVADISHKRGLTLAVARDVVLADSLDAQLVHNPSADPGDLPFSRSAHSFEEAKAACRSGASLIFLSPIQATRSHPGQEPLTRKEVQRILAACPVPVIALGGMSRERFVRLRQDGFYGWAGIDAWLVGG